MGVKAEVICGAILSQGSFKHFEVLKDVESKLFKRGSPLIKMKLKATSKSSREEGSEGVQS